MKIRGRKRATYLLIGLIGILLLLSLGVALWPQPPTSGLTIQFLGFTNVPGQPGSAVFGITNVSRRTMSFVSAQPQVRTGSVWSGAVVVRTPAIGLGLEAGRGTNVAVDVPEIAEVWRLPVVWCYDLSAAEFFVRRTRNLLRTAQHGSLSGWREGFGLDGCTNFSSEIRSRKVERAN